MSLYDVANALILVAPGHHSRFSLGGNKWLLM